MNRDQKLAILQRWEKRMTEANELIEPVIDALKLSPESPICNAMWSLQGALTEAVQDLIDGVDWLSWYANENDMGRRGMAAGLKDDLRPIRTLEDLLWAIEVTA